MTPPRVLAREIECPTCHSPAGTSCANLADGRRMETVHARRRELARELNAAQFPVHVRGQLDLLTGREVQS